MANDYDLKAQQILLDDLMTLRNDVVEEGREIFASWEHAIARKEFRPCALNMAYYMALRRRNVVDIQEALSAYGLSSLGRAESRVMQNLDAVVQTLSMVADGCGRELNYAELTDQYRGREYLEAQSLEIFGQKPPGRDTHIMVTLPPEAAQDGKFIRRLIEAGTTCLRINCAHDTPEMWQQMIDHARKAEKDTGRRVKICMDIAGPKTRIRQLLSRRQNPVVLPGDRIFLTGRQILENFAACDLVISCTLPEIIPHLMEGDHIYIDDGRVIGRVVERQRAGVVVEIDKVLKEKGVRLKAEKGLNFPDADIPIDIITDQDRQALDFICQHADMVAVSFVKDARDIVLVQEELAERMGDRADEMAVIAKIETLAGVNNLPEIIVQGAGKNPFGVMIARGDLAVEVGYIRLAELQEEILWICESGSIPVIWATQVLETMVKSGIPTRAEMTDAASSRRAECVMMNKGPHIFEAVETLAAVHERMMHNVSKKAAKLRALNIAIKLWPESDELEGSREGY